MAHLELAWVCSASLQVVVPCLGRMYCIILELRNKLARISATVAINQHLLPLLYSSDWPATANCTVLLDAAWPPLMRPWCLQCLWKQFTLRIFWQPATFTAIIYSSITVGRPIQDRNSLQSLAFCCTDIFRIKFLYIIFFPTEIAGHRYWNSWENLVKWRSATHSQNKSCS